MNDVIIANKKAGDSNPLVGIVDEKDGIMCVMVGKPDFVINPLTKKMDNIIDVWLEKEETKCPVCKMMNKYIWIRQLESGLIVYECPKCKKFHFLRREKK